MSAALASATTTSAPTRTTAAGRVWRLGTAAFWLSTGLASLAFAVVPLAVETQFVFGIAMLMTLLLLRHLPRTRATRIALIIVASLVVLRYLAWRVTATLPDIADPISFTLGILLLLAEFYAASILAISLVVNADPLTRVAPPMQSDASLPTVDILIPTYNEDEKILAMTVAAACAIDYPKEKLTVWLLDDGGTDAKCADPDPAKAAAARTRRQSLSRLAAALGAVYSARAENDHAKAGNLNSGLAKSTSEIVVVLDADHAPFRSFLRETVGHFAQDPRLFLVQTPHVFLNPDPIEKNLQTFDRMPSENEMFYGITQRGLDKWNGSFFCGSAALLRRAALDETGGFSGVTITEDCETALELHARGWTSVYVDTPLIAGLQPETFADFIGQRSRWCQGMFQILVLKHPMFRSGLAVIQRLCYVSSMSFWFFPLPRLILMIAPLMYIFFDLRIFVSNIQETIAYTSIYMASTLILQNALFGRLRWPLMSELYEYCQGMHLCRAIVAVIVSPRHPTFKVTAKGQLVDRDHLSPLAAPFVFVFLLLAAGVAMAAWRYAFEPATSGLMLVIGIWAAMNLVIAGAALGAVTERAQTERDPSLPIDRSVLLRRGDRTVMGRAVDVSSSGCVVSVTEWGRAEAPTPDERILISLDEDGSPAAAARVVRAEMSPSGEIRLGLAFDLAQPRDAVFVAALMYGDAAAILRFVDRRRAQKGLVVGCLEMVRWSLVGPTRALTVYLANRGSLRSAAPVTAALGTTRPAIVAASTQPETSPDIPAPRAQNGRAIVADDLVFAIAAAGDASRFPGTPDEYPPGGGLGGAREALPGLLGGVDEVIWGDPEIVWGTPDAPPSQPLMVA